MNFGEIFCFGCSYVVTMYVIKMLYQKKTTTQQQQNLFIVSNKILQYQCTIMQQCVACIESKQFKTKNWKKYHYSLALLYVYGMKKVGPKKMTSISPL